MRDKTSRSQAKSNLQYICFKHKLVLKSHNDSFIMRNDQALAKVNHQADLMKIFPI
jgi:hypothetical protein